MQTAAQQTAPPASPVHSRLNRAIFLLNVLTLPLLPIWLLMLPPGTSWLRRLLMPIVRRLVRLLLAMVGVRFVLAYTDRPSYRPGTIYVCNCTSQLDFLGLWCTLPGDVRLFGSSRYVPQLVFPPLLPRLLTLSGSGIAEGVQRVRLRIRASRLVEGGTQVVFIPSAKAGAHPIRERWDDTPFILASKLGRPIVPVAIVPVKGREPMCMVACPPLDGAQYRLEDSDILMKKVQAAVNDTYRKFARYEN